MTIETLADTTVEFFRQELGNERLAECQELAQEATTPQLAAEQGILYTDLLYKNFMYFLTESYRAERFRRGE